MNNNTKIELGKRITVFRYLKRKSKYKIDKSINEYKATEFKEWQDVDFKNPKEVMIVGVRTLSQGYNQWDSDMGNMYTPQSYFSALLVVENLRSKPFYIQNTDFIIFEPISSLTISIKQ